MKANTWHGALLWAVMSMALGASAVLVQLAEPGNEVYAAAAHGGEPLRTALDELADQLANP